MDTAIQAQHSEVHPRWRDMIEHRAAKLHDYGHDILRLHVTLVHSRHHLRGAEEVRILATVPHETFKTQKAMADMGAAIHAAFEALEHEMHGFFERRRDLQRRAKRAAARMALQA